ncbi:hypothetical protein Pmani_026258 [Petrolisthes manimaculis]|uniref:Uncharacterized protein n=1 Tax=Petrolisthes manimaculis TaxID=1843537 RepID=A0AAE1P697_9EUCA|nr:hypothetical protein Pmani_026258 [Petrolisthes manimaculis]
MTESPELDAFDVERVFDRHDTEVLDGSPAPTQEGQRSDGSRHRHHIVIGSGRHCGTLYRAQHSYKNAGDLEWCGVWFGVR